MVGLAPVTAAALHPASPLHPLATHSQRVSSWQHNIIHFLATSPFPALWHAQLHWQLRISCKRFSHHRPQAEPLGQGKPGEKRGFHFSQVSYLVTGTSPAAQNILFSICGCPQANPVIWYQLTLLSKTMFSSSGTFRRDCVPRAIRHELTEPAPLWSRSEHTRVSCLPVPHTRGEPSGVRAGGAPGVQAGGGDLPGPPLLGGGRLVGSTLGRRPHC